MSDTNQTLAMLPAVVWPVSFRSAVESEHGVTQPRGTKRRTIQIITAGHVLEDTMRLEMRVAAHETGLMMCSCVKYAQDNGHDLSWALWMFWCPEEDRIG